MRKTLLTITALLTLIFFVCQTDSFAQKKKTTKKSDTVSRIQREAESEARYVWEDWISRCGADYYTRDEDYLYQFKAVRISVGDNSLSQADKLNDVEFTGYTYFNVGVSRTYDLNSSNYEFGDAGWSKWYDGLNIPKSYISMTMYLRKENGVWNGEPVSKNQFNNFERVDCSNIYATNYARVNPNIHANNNNNSPSNNNNYPNNISNNNRYPINPNNGNVINRSNVSWIRSSVNQDLPSNAIAGGVELNNYGRTLYVCRADYNGGTHPGKLTDGYCNFGFGGKEISLANYEVATGNGYWGKPYGNYINALVGGRETERARYVCRANYREATGYGNAYSGQIPGKVIDGKCNFSFETKEISTTDFEVFYPNSYSY